MSLLVTILSFLVTIGILVVIHEYGHYWAARRVGVKILRFSIGFGRVVWSRQRGSDQTEWAISAIPLGGYVKMLDEREGAVRSEELHRAFNRQGVAARIFIVLAGPAANFLLAFLIYWVLFIAGLPGMKPVLGDPPRNTPAAVAGLANGDTVRAIADEPVFTWTDVRWMLLKEAVKRESVLLEVQAENGAHSVRRLDLSGITKDDLDRDFFGKLGLRPLKLPAEFGRILPGSPAERAGFQAGDRVVTISGQAIASWSEFMSHVAASPGKLLVFEVERDGRRIEIRATPERAGDDAKRGRLGVEAGAQVKREYERMTTTVRYGPLDAIPKAAHKVYDLSVFSIKMLGRMIVGDVSWKNLSGPITIADYAGQSAQLGWITFMGFLALVSVSLGVLNLLPIPLLDGGHLVYYLAEIVMRRPVSERVMEIGQRFGLALLLGLTFFAFYNDLNRLFTG
jgi:regulator of sigma E protease